MTTIAEMLIEKGKTAGIEEGWKQGLQQGLEQGLVRGLERGRSEGSSQGETKGKLLEARGVLSELLEEQFGIVTSSLVEKLDRVQSYSVLVSLRRRRKHCRTLEELESLVEQAMQ
jgi:flagellar biosynthesis/type III secretory pathway protein FliH